MGSDSYLFQFLPQSWQQQLFELQEYSAKAPLPPDREKGQYQYPLEVVLTSLPGSQYGQVCAEVRFDDVLGRVLPVPLAIVEASFVRDHVRGQPAHLRRSSLRQGQ